MNRTEETRKSGRMAPIHALFAAAMVGLLVMPIAFAGASSPEAQKSASAKVQIKSLKRRVAALENKAAPAAPTIPTTLPPSGPAGGDLIGSYPSPRIGPGTIQADELGTEISVQSGEAQVAPGDRAGLSVTCPDGSRLLSGGYEVGNPDGAGMRVVSSGTVVPDGVNPNLHPNNNPVWGVVAHVDAGGTANTIRAKALCLAP